MKPNRCNAVHPLGPEVAAVLAAFGGEVVSVFRPATKTQCKLRAAIAGPSGSGKTYSALRIAKGLGGKAAVIDTERRSAAKYSDRFDFDVADLDDRRVDCYLDVISEAAKSGYEVLIIDSLSHGWQELLQEVDRLARAKFGGNTWAAWSEGTPKQRKLIDALLGYPGHVIATMRVATEWSQEKDEKTGKTRPVRVGLRPEQGKGIEYEFDVVIELSPEHTATVIKDRTGKFQDAIIEKPDEQFGAALAEWLSQGAPPPALPVLTPLEQLKALVAEYSIPLQTQTKWLEHFNVSSLDSLSADQASSIVTAALLKFGKGNN